DAAISKSKELVAKGDVPGASRELIKNGQALMREGKYDDARRCYQPLKQAPFAGQKVNLTRDVDDGIRGAQGQESDVFSTWRGDVKTQGKKADFESTYEAVADRGIAQANQAEEMSKSTKTPDGKPFDPKNVEHVKAYFQQL